MRITALAENTSADDCLGFEHGLSLYIETKEHNILFDMGQSDLFLKNAEMLSVDLKNVDFAVLSHSHYDHSTGMKRFLEHNLNAKVYLSRYAFNDYYNGDKYIGIDKTLKNSDRLVLCGDVTKITDSLTLYSCNDRKKEFDLGSFSLSVMKDGKLYPDDFLHEHYLLIEENNKHVLISGCSHKGVLNIVKWFSPDVLVGGFHFSKLKLDDTLADYAKYLDSFDTEYYTCHCTGVNQYSFMKEHMSRLNYLSTGTTIEV